MAAKRKELKTLSPTEFENLCFDLLSQLGMKNIVWRTPGADGGRDIECDSVRQDYFGGTEVTRWYVEMKRYSKTVGWPTVDEKLSYAKNNEADYLLMMTTAKFSPACLNEVSKHNAKRIRPTIKLWPGHQLDLILDNHRLLLSKFGLRRKNNLKSLVPFKDVMFEITKLTQTSVASVAFDQPDHFGEAVCCLSELATARLDDMEKHERFLQRKWRTAEDSFPWLKIDGQITTSFDSYGLRAMLCAYRAQSGLKQLCVMASDNLVKIADGRSDLVETSLYKHIQTLGLLRMDVRDGEVHVVPQN